MALLILKNLIAILAITTISEVKAQCNKTVIVIGAGVAGLGAAKELKAQGCNVTVLEARNRTGGRIFTDTMGSNKVDMGAIFLWNASSHNIDPVTKF